MRTATALTALAAALLLLTGCGGPPAQPGADPGAEPGASGDPVATAPTPLLDLDCAGLADRAVLDAAFSPATVQQQLAFEGSGGYYPLSQHGLAQAGALRCEFSDLGAEGPERYALLSVLPDAEAPWQRLLPEIALFQPQTPGYGDDARQDCFSGDYVSCRIDVLVGDRWLSAVLGGLTSADAAGPLIESVVAAIAAAAPIAAAWSADSTAPASCDALLTAADVEAALGVALQPWERAAPTQPVLYHAGFEAAGGLFCSWRNDFSAASAMTAEAAVLPGGAWAWAEYWAITPSDRVDREQVPGLGDEAWAGCTGDVVCWVSVRVGEDWLDVSVNDESVPDEREAAIELARLIVPNL